MSAASLKSALSPARSRLVVLMQDIDFGRVEELVVRNGEPVLDRPPRVIREVKFAGENGPRPELAKKDFALKAQVREMFAQFDALGNCVILCLEVKHGLPFRMQIEETAA